MVFLTELYFSVFFTLIEGYNFSVFNFSVKIIFHSCWCQLYCQCQCWCWCWHVCVVDALYYDVLNSFYPCNSYSCLSSCLFIFHSTRLPTSGFLILCLLLFHSFYCSPLLPPSHPSLPPPSLSSFLLTLSILPIITTFLSIPFCLYSCFEFSVIRFISLPPFLIQYRMLNPFRSVQMYFIVIN